MRVIVAAIVGFLMVVVGSDALAQAKPAAPAGPTKVEVVNPVEIKEVDKPWRPSPLEVPCKGDKSDKFSDLCAQWRSAEAVEEGNNWAKFSAIAGVIGGLISAISLILLWLNLLEMRSQGRQEYRAYVRLEPIITKLEVGSPVGIQVVHHNYGRTPANRLRSAVCGSMLNVDEIYDESIAIPNSEATEVTLHNGMPYATNFNFLPTVLKKEDFEKFIKGESIWRFRYSTFYIDVFGQKHETHIHCRIKFHNGTAIITSEPDGNWAN